MSNIDAEIVTKEIGTPIQRGRSSEVYDWGEGKILKLYFKEYPEENVDLEYANTLEANRLGATPMRAYQKVKVGDRYGLVFDKLDGVTMNDAPGKNPLIIFSAGKILADEHVRLQKLKSNALPDVREVACSCFDDAEIFDFLSADEREKAKAYIRALPSDNTFLHLDFHTGNVLIDPKTKKTVVIDWMTAAKGRREVEVALMQFLFKEAELFPEASKLELFFYTVVRKSIGKSFMKNYAELSGVDFGEVEKWKIVALAIRLGLWNIAFEKPYISKEIKRLVSEMK